MNHDRTEILGTQLDYPKKPIYKSRIKKILLTLILLIFFIGIVVIICNTILQNNKQDAEQLKINTAKKEVSISQKKLGELEINSIGRELKKVGECSVEECLFEDDTFDTIQGYATLKGYYQQYEGEAWGNRDKCDALLITGGSKELIDVFKKFISIGNSINKFDKNNNLLVSLEMSNLDNVDKEKILSSNINKQVKIGIIREEPAGRSVPVCYSFVEIIFVK